MRATGYAQVSLKAQKHTIQRLAPSLIDELSVTSRELPGLAFGRGRFRRFLVGFFSDKYDTITLSGRMLTSDLPPLSLAGATQLHLHVEREFVEETVESSFGKFANRWILKGLVGEVVVPFGLDAGVQYFQDLGNPYLTPAKRGYRAALAGGLGLGAAGIGWGIALLGGPPGWITAIVLEVTVVPIVFSEICEGAGWNDEMLLRPIG
jgi:hypothetical protein